MDDEKKSLVAGDYVVFSILLLASALIGVFFAYKDRRNATTKSYYFGDMQMNPIAVGMSVAVTYLSSVTMIGIPAETYIVGTVFLWAVIMIALIGFFTAVHYVPLYYRLGLTNIYEYLELRFDVVTRKIASVMLTLGTIFYMSTTIYLPALAMSAVTPIALEWSILITSAICTFYTTLGGMKAVIWTDVLQSIMMMIGVVSVFIRGMIAIAGVDALSKALDRGERYTFGRFDNYDVASRAHPAAVIIGVFTAFLANVSLSQPAAQRFQSCRSKRQAQLSLVGYIIAAVIIASLTISNGLVMYAYFEGCDPVKSGKIKKLDQGIPYMALELFADYPGLTGLFIAGIFSGSLSTVSSGVNSFSKVILDETILVKWPNMSERIRIIIGKALAVILGLIVMAIAYLINLAKGNIVRVMATVSGNLMGPSIGLFILGFFFPWPNRIGAIVGVTMSYVVSFWIFFGSIFSKTMVKSVSLPPITTDTCPVNDTIVTTSTPLMNISATTMLATAAQTGSDMFNTTQAASTWFPFDQWVYNINFQYYLLIGIILTVVFGLIISFLTGPTPPSNLDPRLFIPLIDSSCFPSRLRYFLRLGVPVIEEKDEKMASEVELDAI